MSTLYKFLKKPFFGRFMTKHWINPLSEEQQKQWTAAWVKSRSGGRIRVMHANSKTGHALATLVLGHPMGKEAKGYFIKNGYTDLYRTHGFNVVIFDVNGFGESTHGNFSYSDDIIAVGEFACRQFPSVPLGYHGISLSAQMAIVSFADNHPFGFAIIESAATTLEEFWIRYPLAYRSLKLFSLITPKFARKVRMIDRISETRNLRSILLIYSQNDEYTPLTMGERFQKKSNVPAELWTLPKADHAKAMQSEFSEQYKKKLISFVEQQVGGRSLHKIFNDN